MMKADPESAPIVDNTLGANLLHEHALQSQLPDVRVQVIYYIFLSNLIFCVGVMLIAGIPYYHYFGRSTTQYAFLGFTIAWALVFVCMSFAVFEKYLQTAIYLGILWWLLTSGLVGLIAALSYNIAPIQFMLLSFGQSLVMIAYTRVSVRYVNIPTAVALMVCATAVLWSISIYGFVVEQDWVSASIIGVLSLLLVVYNTLQIHNTENRYDASWEQGVTAVLQYYCDYMVKLFKYAINA